MGLSTHVLDTMHGAPAAGMAVALYNLQGEAATLVKSLVLNADGRNPDGLLYACLLYTSPSPRDRTRSRMPSSA